jgi:hypothetical protein
MPLSQPVAREQLHRRSIEIHGYHRADGLFDIEAHLIDTKSRGFDSYARGHVAPGEPLHEMWLRLSFDQHMVIVTSEAVTDNSPFPPICPNGASVFSKLVGLAIKPGFIREANARVGGTAGCTHLRELLQQIATTAVQTIGPMRGKPAQDDSGKPSAGAIRMLNSCYAYASSSPVVQRRRPELYTGPDALHPAKAATSAD